MAKQWNAQLVEDMKVYFENDYTDEEIAEALGFRDPRTIAFKRRKLGLMRRDPGGVWTDTRMSVLIDPGNWHLSNREMAAKLGVDQTTVHRKRRELGLPHRFLRRWTEQELGILRRLYPTGGAEVVAERIGRKPKEVANKAGILGVRRIGAASRARR